jgi:hypothetical protein
MKIRKFLKNFKKPISREFKGRSEVAKTKLRHRGKFIKKSELENLILSGNESTEIKL